MEVNVLGTPYKIVESNNKEHPLLTNMDGYCDFSSKKIYINDISKEGGYEWEDANSHKAKVIRHELIHAFLYESGLDIESEWARNEELIDWFAIQIPKIQTIFNVISIL